jgi:hypothetical protein
MQYLLMTCQVRERLHRLQVMVHIHPVGHGCSKLQLRDWSSWHWHGDGVKAEI